MLSACPPTWLVVLKILKGVASGNLLRIAFLSRAMPLDRAMPSEARFVHSEVTVDGVYGSAPLTFREVNIFGLLDSWRVVVERSKRRRL